MKILHVTKKYPRALGGDAVVVANLQKEQQAAGHTVVIVTSNCDEISANAQVYKVGLKDTPMGLDAITLKRMASLTILFFRMFKILGHERPDVIHTHSIDMAFLASFAARFYNIPMVHTFHIVTFYDINQPVLRRKMELWFAKRARLSSATAPNAYDVKKLQTAGLRQATLLPNGVDLAFWKVDAHPADNSKFTFISVGRLEQQKGYKYLIRATALLANTVPTTAFGVIIVGEGSESVALRELARVLHVEGIVKFAGRKKPKEIRALLAGADAAVFPSLYETTPLTMLEAWAAAVPTIVTSVGIVRDAPDDFGAAYVVPPKDEQSLMLVMNRCMTNEPSRLSVATEGHAEAQKYAWPTVARTAEAIYWSAV